MNKIITFLGRRPLETRYDFGGKVYTGRVFAEALCQFVAFDQMLVCVTEEARRDAWPVLEALHDPRIQAVPIPRGESTGEMWEMFDAITSRVERGESVIFDITHGLRSLPFLVFLFAAYLKSAKQVNIKAIYYGALELGDPNAGKPAPVIDLSEFTAMLEWLTASERFVRFGDSKDLATLLQRAGTGKEDDPLAQATQTLEALSQALRLIRPADAMQISAQLPEMLEAAREGAEKIPAARPYLLLVDDLKQAYAVFAQPEPFNDLNLEIGLRKQRDLIQWYVEHQQWVQAVSLAREWLISWVMWHLGETDFLNQSLRESIAGTMSNEAQRRKEAKEQKRAFRPLLLGGVPQISDVLGDWISLASIRNDIDHAGMRTHSKEAAELVRGVKTLCSKLNGLPLHRAEA